MAGAHPGRTLHACVFGLAAPHFLSKRMNPVYADAFCAFCANDNALPFAGPDDLYGLVLVQTTADTVIFTLLKGAEGLTPPVMGLPLLCAKACAEDTDDFLALWRGLGRKFGVALYALTPEGMLAYIEGGVIGEAHFGRRSGSALTGRRTRTASKRFAALAPHKLASTASMNNPKNRIKPANRLARKSRKASGAGNPGASARP